MTLKLSSLALLATLVLIICIKVAFDLFGTPPDLYSVAMRRGG